MSRIDIVEVRGQRDLKTFVDVPYRLKQDYPNWGAAVAPDNRRIAGPVLPSVFRTRRNALVPRAREERVLGRIALIDNRLSNETLTENSRHFGFFDSANDDEVAAALFATVETAARANGASHLRGPFNHSVHDEIGLQVSGFDRRNYVMIPGNPDYYPRLVAKNGYCKCIDLHCYHPAAEQLQSEDHAHGAPARKTPWNNNSKCVEAKPC